MSTQPVAAVRRSLRGWFLFAVGMGAVVLGAALAGRALRTPTADQAFDPVTWSDRVQAFTTIFLGIFIEAVPFVAIGALLSGVIEMAVSTRTLARWVPKRAGAGVLAGAALGLVFPVCECGVVLVVRRLLSKGLPPPVAIAFLLGAPVLNPVVIASTATAFGFGWMLIGRLALTLVVATAVASAFRRTRPADILLAADHVDGEHFPAGGGHVHDHDHDHDMTTTSTTLVTGCRTSAGAASVPSRATRCCTDRPTCSTWVATSSSGAAWPPCCRP